MQHGALRRDDTTPGSMTDLVFPPTTTETAPLPLASRKTTRGQPVSKCRSSAPCCYWAEDEVEF